MRNAFLALLYALVFPASAVEIRVATFNIGAHFGTTYFDYSLGDAGTPDHESVEAVLERIDADVVALQEIHSVDLQGNPNDLDDLAASLGYSFLHVTPVTGAFDTSLRVVIMSRFPFLSQDNIGSPPGAKELARLHPIVKVDVPGTGRDLVMVAAHLKAGTALADRFRRAVEMKRLIGHLSSAGLTNDDNYVIVGDFNPSSIDATFNSLPTGLPETYALGSDVGFPISYAAEPLDYFAKPGAARLDPRQLDGADSTFDTTAADGPTLDLILVSPSIAGRPIACEVYNSALDVANGTGLAKAGSPPAADTSANASDHYAVFADLNLDDAVPYVFTAPAQTVVEDFKGFAGNHDPARWSTAGGLAWRGVDDGSSAMAGLRSYGAAGDPSLGVLSAGAVATASAVFVNQSALPVTALRFSLDVEQWRAGMNGAADSLGAELVTGGGTVQLPGLAFAADTDLPSGPVPGGVTTTLTATAAGLAIPPGTSFELRVSFNPGAGGGVIPSDVFINEFHYDNTGADTGEFVEIVVCPGFSGVLSDVSLVIYNGDNGAASATHTLDSFIAEQPLASGHLLFHKMIPGLQNEMEGFALVVGSSVIQFISYEGSFTATNGPAGGMVSADIGYSQGITEAAGQSALGLTGTGGRAADFTWTKFSGIAHSPGLANHSQSFILPALPGQGLAIDNLNVTFLSDYDLDGLPDSSDPDDDNDGQADVDEAAFGSDPLDAGSRFLPVLARSAAAPHGFELSFPGAQGIRYTVECGTTLSGWQDLTTHVGTGRLIVIPVFIAEPRMFFRVRAGE